MFTLLEHTYFSSSSLFLEVVLYPQEMLRKESRRRIWTEGRGPSIELILGKHSRLFLIQDEGEICNRLVNKQLLWVESNMSKIVELAFQYKLAIETMQQIYSI